MNPSRNWRQRTPYIKAYHELRKQHNDDVKELKQKVRTLENMIEYMASVMFPLPEEEK